jgi:hypothetical protein
MRRRVGTWLSLLGTGLAVVIALLAAGPVAQSAAATRIVNPRE